MARMQAIRGGTLNGVTQFAPGEIFDVPDELVDTLVGAQFAVLAPDEATETPQEEEPAAAKPAADKPAKPRVVPKK